VEAKKVTVAGALINEPGAIVSNLHNETTLLLNNIKDQFDEATKLHAKNYTSLSEDKQLLLGTLVNNTLSIAEMLNKTVE
jgi:hypothetical protein